jgi:hypothetical protein
MALILAIASLSACTGVLGLDGLQLVRTRPSRPRVDLVAGGGVSRSPKYTLVGALGESPGGNAPGQSTSYSLYGGVVGAAR